MSNAATGGGGGTTRNPEPETVMIEINLLPVSSRRTARRLPRLRLKRSQRLGHERKSIDRWLFFAVLAWLVAPLLAASMFFATGCRRSELEVAIEGARLDSMRHAEMRAANELLLARQDTIAQKLEIIQEIDAGRYVWAHIIDEVSRAIPPFTWLVSIAYLPGDERLDAPRFAIDGRAGSTFALTQLMQDLEASPFIRNVTLVQTDQLRQEDKRLYTFELEAQLEHAPPDVIQTVPIFVREGD